MVQSTRLNQHEGRLSLLLFAALLWFHLNFFKQFFHADFHFQRFGKFSNIFPFNGLIMPVFPSGISMPDFTLHRVVIALYCSHVTPYRLTMSTAPPIVKLKQTGSTFQKLKP